MKFVPYDIENLGFRKTKNYKLLKDFVDSKLKCAKIEGIDTSKKSVYSTANSLKRSAAHFKFSHVLIKTHKGEVYLINVVLAKEELMTMKIES